jgi:hypothetical protein
MSDNNIIKSITSHACPNCGEALFAESQMLPPVVGALFTRKQVEDAKSDCLQRVETLSIDDDKKEQVKEWLNDKGTVFGPQEVDAIILSLLKPEGGGVEVRE